MLKNLVEEGGDLLADPNEAGLSPTDKADRLELVAQDKNKYETILKEFLEKSMVPPGAKHNRGKALGTAPAEWGSLGSDPEDVNLLSKRSQTFKSSIDGMTDDAEKFFSEAFHPSDASALLAQVPRYSMQAKCLALQAGVLRYQEKTLDWGNAKAPQWLNQNVGDNDKGIANWQVGAGQGLGWLCCGGRTPGACRTPLCRAHGGCRAHGACRTHGGACRTPGGISLTHHPSLTGEPPPPAQALPPPHGHWGTGSRPRPHPRHDEVPGARGGPVPGWLLQGRRRGRHGIQVGCQVRCWAKAKAPT